MRQDYSEIDLDICQGMVFEAGHLIQSMRYCNTSNTLSYLNSTIAKSLMQRANSNAWYLPSHHDVTWRRWPGHVRLQVSKTIYLLVVFRNVNLPDLTRNFYIQINLLYYVIYLPCIIQAFIHFIAFCSQYILSAPSLAKTACLTLPVCKQRWASAGVLCAAPGVLVCGDRGGTVHCYHLSPGDQVREGCWKLSSSKEYTW